jgi:hypothetical protein
MKTKTKRNEQSLIMGAAMLYICILLYYWLKNSGDISDVLLVTSFITVNFIFSYSVSGKLKSRKNLILLFFVLLLFLEVIFLSNGIVDNNVLYSIIFIPISLLSTILANALSRKYMNKDLHLIGNIIRSLIHEQISIIDILYSVLFFIVSFVWYFKLFLFKDIW